MSIIAISHQHMAATFSSGVFVPGTIMTFNFAINGRHLAGQEYRACIRRNVGFCAVRYMPCDSRSFRIGPGGDAPVLMDPAGESVNQ